MNTNRLMSFEEFASLNESTKEYQGHGNKLTLNVSKVYDYVNVSFDGSYNLIDTKGLSEEEALDIINKEFEVFVEKLHKLFK